MARPAAKLLGLGVALTLLTLAALLVLWPVGLPATHEFKVNVFVALLAAAVIVYFAAVRLVLRSSPDATAVWVVLASAALLRLMLLPAPPLLSSDIYRYVWDGQVQRAGINPYRYIPADPALATLRDPQIYPNVNRREYARTIYPPAAQIVFAAIGRLTASVLGTKLAILAFEALGIACVLRLLSRAGLPRERVLIYAWNPLPLWSFACDGHVDGIAIGFLGLALLLRTRRREGLAGVALAAAALTKFIPIAVAPAFARGGRWGRSVVTGLATIVVLYAWYAGVGPAVFGFLSGYGAEEKLDTGGGFWLLAGLGHLAPLPAWASAAYMAAVTAAYATISLWLMRDRSDPYDGRRLCRDTAVLAAFATAAISPHYVWYMAWIALPCAVAPLPAAIWFSSASVLLYVDPFDDRFLWPSLVYVPTLALAAISVSSTRATRAPPPIEAMHRVS